MESMNVSRGLKPAIPIYDECYDPRLHSKEDNERMANLYDSLMPKIQKRLSFLQKIKKRSHLKESRFSTIGNLLARERSLRKFGKKRLKRMVKRDPNAHAVLAVSEPSLGPFSFHMFWPKERTHILDCGSQTSGSAASRAINSGTRLIEVPIGLGKSGFTPSDLKDSITKSKISSDLPYLKNLNNDGDKID